MTWHALTVQIYHVAGEAEPASVTALEFIVNSAREKVARLEREIEEMSMADTVDDLGLELKYEELEELDPSTFEAKASSILHGLGFDAAMMAKHTKDMSGGCAGADGGQSDDADGACVLRSLGRSSSSRICCCSTSRLTCVSTCTASLIAQHLDLEAVVWLEAYLSTYNHILLFTSHSADFMDNVCTNIIDITLQRKMITYGGNYSTYVRTKTENETNQMKAYAKQQEEIQHIKKCAASWATAD